MARINQRLNGLNPLSYLGFDAVEPTDFIKKERDPLTSDFNNFYLGTWWLNTVTNSLFYLAALENGSATWVSASSKSGLIETLTGNEGGAVPPTAGNINLVGDGSTIDIAGNPGTSTLTMSAIDPNIISSLTGDTGGPINPDDTGNINLIGSGGISIAGNPGTSTLTISQTTPTQNTYNTQSGSATPAAGVLTINGANGLSTTGSGNTVTIIATGDISSSYITSPATGTAIPAAGVITFTAGANTTISAAGSSITVNNTGGGGGGPTYSTGTFTPSFTTMGGAVYSTQFGNYVQIGSIVFIHLLIEASSIPGGANIIIQGFPFAINASKMTRPCTMNAILNNAITPAVGVFKYSTMWLTTTSGTIWTLSGSTIPQSSTSTVNTNGMGGIISVSASGFYFI